jgi:hypothetical protein
LRQRSEVPREALPGGCDISRFIGNHPQPKLRKAPGIAIGVDNNRINLRPDAFNHMLQQGLSTKIEEGLFVAPHARRSSAGDDNSGNLHAWA